MFMFSQALSVTDTTFSALFFYLEFLTKIGCKCYRLRERTTWPRWGGGVVGERTTQQKFPSTNLPKDHYEGAGNINLRDDSRSLVKSP